MSLLALAPAFTSLSPADRTLAVNDAALRTGVSAVILEKDFWVTWMLGALFSLAEVAPHLVFKGGTSLSKVFGVIDRFSEDIDLCLAPTFVGADALAFDALNSRARRDAAVLEMQRLCGQRVQELVQPTLEAAARGVLGAPPPGQTDWLRHELDETAHSPNLYFRYPTQLSAGFAYMPREVKLELGTLTDQQPVARHQIRPLLADAFPQLFDEWSCEVTALALERTFWEKATILHAEFHRPAAQATPDRYARHYADVARLLARADAATHLADAALCAHVVGWKRRVFPRAWARYDLAHAGTFRLLPTQERRAALAQDYAAMQQMFITEPPPFDQVLDQLAEAETQLNAGKKD